MTTILVVDDEPSARGLIVEVLSEAGRVILSAADGYEALRVIAEHHVDLLITDVRMPGITGFELARQAKLMRPNLAVIYLSGHLSTLDGEAGRTFGALLRKPYRIDELLTEIDCALGVV